MPPVVPSPESIRAFENEQAFARWLAVNHAKKSEIFLRIFKKDSGVATITYAQALDVALCWGWIDGLRKRFDERSFLQRFTPRTSKSIWSQVNREHVARLTQAGRMTPHGLAQVQAAQADGRWDAAYAGSSKLSVPADLLAAIEADRDARAFFRELDKKNKFALAFRVGKLKTPAGRARKIGEFVEMLRRGESIYPVPKRK